LLASRSALVLVFAICTLGTNAQAATTGEQPATGTIGGVVADDTGAPISSATVTATFDDGSRVEVATGANGRFLVANVPAGRFTLTVAAHGFAAQTLSGEVAAGGMADVSEIRLRLAVHVASIDVTPSIVEIAERQIKEQEQQRVFGIVPNFYVSFTPDAAPLNPRQKFQLSWKARTDPVQFAFVALTAAIQHARNDYSGFGDGASGYAKRYAAAYAADWTSIMMSRVVLASLFRQDPRYFYKGTGSTRSRVAYALSSTVIRKGDNGRWQPNYSGILGSLASGAISNFYYPEEDRRGARLTLQNTGLGIAGGAVGRVAQEFLYARFTSRAHARPEP
jgi:Carboxypeptidase regulatory-like domain